MQQAEVRSTAGGLKCGIRKTVAPSATSKLPGVSPGIFYLEVLVHELSIFVDESGSQSGHSRYCLVTLLLHDQGQDIADQIAAYESSLQEKRLPNLPFHASPLMNGHDEYRKLPLGDRKRLLATFEAFARKFPVTYKVFAYKRSEVSTPDLFIARFKKDLVVFLSQNLALFQSYDKVKIYYDNGQQMVTSALHGAIDYMLSKEAVLYRMADARLYRLFQVVDYLCTLELTDLKYRDKCLTETDIKVFGEDYQAFKSNHLKRIRRKALQ